MARGSAPTSHDGVASQAPTVLLKEKEKKRAALFVSESQSSPTRYSPDCEVTESQSAFPKSVRSFTLLQYNNGPDKYCTHKAAEAIHNIPSIHIYTPQG